ncbi:MAG: transposase [Synergistaceae bacterium]|nr:transposase [Synergistaceae bacterium]
MWCPKYRRKMPVGDAEIRLKELLYEKADEIDVQIAKLEIMPNHVHAFVKTRPILRLLSWEHVKKMGCVRVWGRECDLIKCA